MNTRMLVGLIGLLSLLGGIRQVAAQGTAFTYQGRLTAGGNTATGLYDLTFRLYDGQSGGGQVGPALTNAAVSVSNGLFTVVLDFGVGIFAGDSRWLVIGVRTNGGASFSTLAGRQPVTPSPYAIHAADAVTASSATTATTMPWSGLSGVPAGLADGVDNDTTYTAGTGLNLSGTGFSLDTSYTDGRYWKLGGNSATAPGAQFLGTTDDQALELKVNMSRALRLEPNASGAPNVIEGGPWNGAAPGVVGATIGGGGAANYGGLSYTNFVSANFGTIGGGVHNTIQANALQSTVGGGHLNTVQTNAYSATVGGGYLNTIQTDATYATISGGANNTVRPNALYATIPGGYFNAATNYAFAAGRRAKALHTGSLVWADSTDADFTTTSNNQFLLRASGGVGVNKNSPATALDVNGTVTALGFAGSGASLTALNGGALAPGSVSNAALAANTVTSDKIADAAVQPADLNLGSFSSVFWRADGNAGTQSDTQFLGTTDNQPLELRVNNNRALRVEPNSGGANLIGGHPSNSVAAGVYASVIAGGGHMVLPNRIESRASAIGGGLGNTIQSNSVNSTIAGGSGNTIQIGAAYSSIAGGMTNMIQDSAAYSTVGGGFNNVVGTNASSATIAGGANNSIQTNADFATIAGGSSNLLQNSASYSAVGGGENNRIQSYAHRATIGGGSYNAIQANASHSIIGGGNQNTIQTNAYLSTIAGGYENEIQTNAYMSTIGGGDNNLVQTNTHHATISGGAYNQVQIGAYHSAVGGGENNRIQSYADHSTISGGQDNVIQGSANGSTIGGGTFNRIQFNAGMSTIGGGYQNTNLGWYAAIPGGYQNVVADYSFAAGRRAKALHDGSLVWADSTDADFATTAGNQFLIRASGGVGIGTNNPQSLLHVAGTVRATDFAGSGAGLNSLNADRLASGKLPDARLSANVALLNSSPTFTGSVTSVGDLQGMRLKVGSGHTLTGTLATIAGGYTNTASGDGAFVGGGGVNVASQNYASVSGGQHNTASGGRATVAGGYFNTASSPGAFVGGGEVNQANNVNATVAGGTENVASGNLSTVSGGENNTASGSLSTVGGGERNSAGGNGSTVGGGDSNTAGGGLATVAGGSGNTASGLFSAVGGGSGNSATNTYTTVPGGEDNVAGGRYSLAAGQRAKALHDGTFVWGDSTPADISSTASNQFLIRATGGVALSDNTPSLSFGGAIRQMLNLWGTSYGIGVQDWTFYQRTGWGFAWYRDGSHTNSQNNPGPGGTLLMRLDQAGNLYTTGAVNPPSDRNAKENFKAVSTREVLEKVAALPVAEWNYKGDAGTRHVGPTAQDFQAAFGLGADDKHIATVDADGVALVAIQGLNEKVESGKQKAESRMDKLEAENAELKQEVAELRRLMTELSARVSGGGQ